MTDLQPSQVIKIALSARC